MKYRFPMTRFILGYFFRENIIRLCLSLERIFDQLHFTKKCHNSKKIFELSHFLVKSKFWPRSSLSNDVNIVSYLEIFVNF